MRALRWIAGIGLTLVALLVATVLLLTQTDFGRERVRRVALGLINKSVHGTINVAHLSGNLFTGLVADSVSITDSAGAHFVSARRLSAHYSIGDLLRKRLDLSDVTAQQPVIALDQSPADVWNFDRIFPSSGAPSDTSQHGFGSWITLHGVRIVDGRFVLRRPWTPDSTLTGAARDRAVRAALSPENRVVVIAVPGGYQQIIHADRVNAVLPLVRVADPAHPERVAQVATLSADLALFRPPVARITDLAAVVHVDADSAWFRDARVTLPASRIPSATGRYGIKTGDLALAVRAAPAALNDLRFGYPRLPVDGTVAAAADVVWHGKAQDYAVRDIDLRTGTARATGVLGLHMGDSLALRQTRLQFTGIDTHLIEQVAPAVHVPRAGVLSGRLAVDGGVHEARIDADVTFDDARTGRSRILAVGSAGVDSTADGRGFHAHDLALTLDNVRVALARMVVTTLPVGGALSGDVHVDGSTSTRLAADADLTHIDRGQTSHVSATGNAQFAGRPRHHPWIEVAATLDPLSLVEAGRFAPAAGLHGAATGTARVTGDLGDLTVHSRLVFTGPVPARPRLTPVPPPDTITTPEPRTGLAPRTSADTLHVTSLQRDTTHADSTGRDTLHITSIQRDTEHADSTGRDTLHITSIQRDTEHADSTGRDALRVESIQRDTLPADSTRRGTTLAQAIANGDVSPAAVSAGIPPSAPPTPPAPRYSLYPGRIGPPTSHDRAPDPVAPADTAGVLTVDGRLDLASRERAYDLHAAANLLDARQITTKSPATSLTATAVVTGHGTALATMQATVAADVHASVVDSVAIDTLSLRAAVAAGSIRIDTAHVRLHAARADLAGTLGLVAGRTGRLTYSVTIDSLSTLRRFFPSDTGAIHPGPGRLATAYARTFGDTTGTTMPVEAQLALDTVAIRRDLLAGWIHAAGVVTGSIKRFDLRGRAAATDVIAMRNTVRRARAEYAWIGGPSLASPIVAGVQLDTVGIGRFALDSIDARVAYHKPDGSLLLLVRQRGVPETAGGPPTHDQEYTANADFALKLDARQLRFRALALTFDTTTWRTPAAPAPPGTVEWGGDGIAVRALALSNGRDGRIALDATLPRTGPLNAHLDVEHLEVGELATLIESRLKAHGDLTLTTDASGTAHSPRFDGTMAMLRGNYDGYAVPDIRSTFHYDGTALGAHAELATNIGDTLGRVFATADGHVAVDLSLDHDSTSRLNPDGPVALDVKADSLPLELLPELITTVQDVHGRASSQFTIRGTINKPVPDGYLALEDGSVLIVPLNIRLSEMAGAIRAKRDSLVVDSLVARSDGKMRVSGYADLTDPSVPVVTLLMQGTGVRAINSKQYGWAFVDDSLTVVGPLNALNFNGPPAHLYVDGQVRVTDGVFYAPDVGARQPLDLTDPVVYRVADTTDHAIKDVIPQPVSVISRLLMDVNVQVDPQVWVRNKDANVEIYTDGPLTLRVQQQRIRSALVLDGVVATERGQYTFLSKRFQITKGSADFIGTPDLNPSVQATAIYPVTVPGREPVDIEIDIAGTAQQPTIRLTSDAQPPLSQSDLISYLAFGSSSASLLPQSSSGGGGTGAGTSGLPIGEAGAYVQQQLTSVAIGTLTQQVQGDIARTLDADVFNISSNSDTPLQLSQAGVSNYFTSMRFEFGKYWTPTTYIAIQASAAGWTTSPPGALVQSRIGARMSILATYQPYFLLQQPSLTPITLGNGVFPTKVFGLFLVRDWRF